MNLPRLLFRLILGRRLPTTQGTMTIPGLEARVRIHRDRWGVPHIEAQNDADASFALGFCHAQDRSFQLELLSRLVRGRLAELIGPRVLPLDRLSRRIGFWHAAGKQLEVLDDDLKTSLEAYARGVAAGRERGQKSPPHEFLFLGSTPSPWTPQDTLGLSKVIGFTLCSNWDVELVRLRVLMMDGPEALALVNPVYPENHPVTIPVGALAGKMLDRLSEDLHFFLEHVQMPGRLTGEPFEPKPGEGESTSRPGAGPAAEKLVDSPSPRLFPGTGEPRGGFAPPPPPSSGGGSNSWVLASQKTATGRPILANDPHLRAVLPAHWYLAQIRTPHWAVAGASYIGGPSFPAGHNGIAAWGVTAGLVDNTDLFLEKLGPDGQSVLQGEDQLSCPVREEVIQVKNGEAITERVLMTPRGPIISPALENSLVSPPWALSLRATWLDPHPIDGLLRLHRARSWDEFQQFLARWSESSQNLVYADTTGTIGWRLMGRAPRRTRGWGLIPQPGWLSEVGWEPEPVPFSEMPSATNPEEGLISTANAAPVVSENTPYLGMDWLAGSRQRSIQRALLARNDWDVSSTQALQVSQECSNWDEVREIVFSLQGKPGAQTEEVQLAHRLLREWDGQATVDSPAAAVYELFLSDLLRVLIQAYAPRSWEAVLGKSDAVLTRVNFFCFRQMANVPRLLANWKETASPARGGRGAPENLSRGGPRAPENLSQGSRSQSREDIVAESLRNVIQRLRQLRGNDPARWAWGDVRKLILPHPMGTSMLRSIFNRGPFPCGGDSDTINQASVLPLDPLAAVDNIASVRVVIDVGAWHNSRFCLPGGQSGNPLSPHYDDQLPIWRKGEGIPIAFTPEEVEKARVHTLDLNPEEGTPPEGGA